MRSQGYEYLETLLKMAKAEASDLAPWPNYFESKTKELRTILGFYDLGKPHNLLEIGCGNGYTSALLSGKADRVVAFDLPAKSAGSHSMGIGVADELMKRLNVKNVKTIGGSVEELPFPDNSFDIVFSEYMLQYVKNKDKALSQIRRVLNDKGVAITIVPNFTERVAAPLLKYKYVIKRAFSYIAGAKKQRNTETNAKASFADEKAPDKQKSMLDWLMLKPDGAYNSFMEETLRHTPVMWKRLFEDNGFRIVKTFSTELLVLELFDVLGYGAKAFMSRESYRLNRLFGSMPIIKNLGYSYGMVAMKDLK